jgi:hypothetical protein
MFDNKVVVRYRDGHLLKGFTHDFSPDKHSFHVLEEKSGKKTKVINTGELKAVFFVKSFEGDCRRIESPDWEGLKTAPGIKVKVTFRDGEVIYGTSSVYNRRRLGFFIRPADQDSNNERLYVIASSTAHVETWV